MGIQRLSNLSGRFIRELEIGLLFPNLPCVLRGPQTPEAQRTSNKQPLRLV